MTDKEQQQLELDKQPQYLLNNRQEALFTSRREKEQTKHLFIGIVIAGLMLHAGAMYLTYVGLASGQFSELNPLYYGLGNDLFTAFGFALLAVSYAVLWSISVPYSTKLVIAMVLTAVAGFDFFHDATSVHVAMNSAGSIRSVLT